MNTGGNWQPPGATHYGAVENARDRLNEWYDHRRHLIEDGIRAFLERHYEGQISAIVGHIAHGGKYLRGTLAILVCEALGGTAKDALTAAVAVEMAHAASLAHDDIIDGDVARRGRVALHVRYDIPTAILIPHLVVPHSVLSTEVYGPQATSIILKGWSRVVRGQVRDYVSTARWSSSASRGMVATSESGKLEYWRIIRDKTAALFETAAVLGATAAREHCCAPAIQLYARRLGIAYQIADDIVDLQAHMLEPLSTVLAASNTSQSMRAIARMIAASGEDAITPATIARGRDFVSIIVRRSEECVARLPDSPTRALLRIFPAFAIDQMYMETRDDEQHPIKEV